jgi:CHAT domain-containing protein/tetratricopeptide (TPR) repeat protein
MDDTELRLYAAEALRQMDLLHPSIEQVADYAAGQLSGSSREDVETHLAECDQCRRRLEEYRRFVADCEAPAGKEPEQDLSDEWEQLRRRIWRYRLVKALSRWGGIAAAVIAVAGLSWFTVRTLSPSPARLLAQAYHEQRKWEFRLAGAQHSEVRQQRGGDSAFSAPAALLKAQARLAEANPEDPEVLRMKGEAEMMSGHAGAAIGILESARDLKPQEPHVLADLGTAYALRGDIEKQYGDYVSATEHLGHAVHIDPRNSEAVFNLALAFEKMMLKDQAIEQWQNYLKLDSMSDWAKEARQRLDGLERALQSREDAVHQTLDDPAQFLGRIAVGSPIDAEAYLRDVVITKWLPLATSEGPAREATIRLAQILRDRHGDTWLTDMVSSLSGTDMLTSLRSLGAARAGNLRRDDMDATLASAKAAREGLLRCGSRTGSLWARFEEVLSLHGLLRHDECLAAADALIRDLEAGHYIWECAELRIEYAICAMRLGRLSDAATQLRQALAATQVAGFRAAALTASTGYFVCAVQIGLPSESFASAERSLREFWSGTYPIRHFYVVVDELRDIVSRSDQKYSAWFLARAGAWSGSAAADPRTEALARANAAVAAQDIGERTEARINLEISDRLFAKIPSGYRWEPEISLAKVELGQGDADAALRRLEDLRNGSSPPSVLVQTLFHSALGKAHLLKGQLNLAADEFRQSIDQGTRRVASLSSERERSGVLDTIEDSYRGLVATRIGSSADGCDGLRTWQSFRALDAFGDVRRVPVSNGTVLWFVELPDEFVCWLSKKDHVSVHHIDARKPDVASTAARFLRECSDPRNSVSRLREDAQLLYRWMVEPFADQLQDEEGSLIFELDGALRGIPVQALMTPDGRYLGDRFSVLVSSGYARPGHADVPGPGARALVIVNPELGGESAELFPPLVDNLKEADTVRRTFPNSATLQGRAATMGALLRSLPTADIVHFAGHGYSRLENGALIFAPKDQKGDYELLRSTELRRQDWSHCYLATLSACAAADGETRGAHNPDSLVRALTRAGVSRVAASFWLVDSAATAELMRRFYTSLAKGDECIQAFRAAQTEVRRLPDWEHPYYWSGFQLYGTM